MIINFIFGWLWFSKGDMPVGKTKRVKPAVAKAIGAMLMLMALVSLMASFIDRNSWLGCLGSLSPVLVFVIGLANLENKPDENNTGESGQSYDQESEEEAQERIEKYGVEVVRCSNCQTINSLSYVYCIECHNDLSDAVPIRNPYFIP